MSAIESIATPVRPTSPFARGSSESYPSCVGRSNATRTPSGRDPADSGSAGWSPRRRRSRRTGESSTGGRDTCPCRARGCRDIRREARALRSVVLGVDRLDLDSGYGLALALVSRGSPSVIIVNGYRHREGLLVRLFAGPARARTGVGGRERGSSQGVTSASRTSGSTPWSLGPEPEGLLYAVNKGVRTARPHARRRGQVALIPPVSGGTFRPQREGRFSRRGRCGGPDRRGGRDRDIRRHDAQRVARAPVQYLEYEAYEGMAEDGSCARSGPS